VARSWGGDVCTVSCLECSRCPLSVCMLQEHGAAPHGRIRSLCPSRVYTPTVTTRPAPCRCYSHGSSSHKRATRIHLPHHKQTYMQNLAVPSMRSFHLARLGLPGSQALRVAWPWCIDAGRLAAWLLTWAKRICHGAIADRFCS
jgi:hypothetical protein